MNSVEFVEFLLNENAMQHNKGQISRQWGKWRQIGLSNCKYGYKVYACGAGKGIALKFRRLSFLKSQNSDFLCKAENSITGIKPKVTGKFYKFILIDFISHCLSNPSQFIEFKGDLQVTQACIILDFSKIFPHLRLDWWNNEQNKVTLYCYATAKRSCNRFLQTLQTNANIPKENTTANLFWFNHMLHLFALYLVVVGTLLGF